MPVAAIYSERFTVFFSWLSLGSVAREAPRYRQLKLSNWFAACSF
jgi:hypothetical protein